MHLDRLLTEHINLYDLSRIPIVIRAVYITKSVIPHVRTPVGCLCNLVHLQIENRIVTHCHIVI